ncbi:L-serine ammonia-lyase, partial [Pseudoxanthomonas sp. SGD-10]
MPEEQLSIFDIFKIGIGPSSSHTLGPWRAAQQFIEELETRGLFADVIHISISLYGSLAKTGVGHGTDVAILLGLSGDDPVTIAVDSILPKFERIKEGGILKLGGKQDIFFNYPEDLRFLLSESLSYHPNGMTLRALTLGGEEYTESYYSIGGGFVVKGSESSANHSKSLTVADSPYPIYTSLDLIHYHKSTGKQISEIVKSNELAYRDERTIAEGIISIIEVMRDSVY